MTPRQEQLQRRAVKAGIRVAKRRHHALSEEELRALKVQVLPVLPRVLTGAAGAGMIASAISGIPADSNAGQAMLGIGGLALILFALLGVRRTLSSILDHLSNEAAGELLETMIKAIADAVDF